jgi:hypothetical protein
MNSMRTAVRMVPALLLVGLVLSVRAEDAQTWSPSVNGLQARLMLVQKGEKFGTRWLIPYLELRNVRELMNQMEVNCGNRNLKIELVDAEGNTIEDRALAMRMGDRSGPVPDLGIVILPHDSSMRISLECVNWGITKAAAMVSADSGAWTITDAGKGKVYLRATLTGDENKSGTWKSWYGTMQTPLIPVDWKDEGKN